MVIACMGDSITYGHGVAQTRKHDAWPFVLQKLLGEGIEVHNYGINGATAIADTPDSYASSGLLDRALKRRADVYILMLGSNDTKERYWDHGRFEAGYLDIVSRVLNQHPKALFLMFPPCAFAGEDGSTAYGVSAEKIKNEIIPFIKKTAGELSLPAIDLYSLTEDHPEYYLEGVHPNVLGNLVIAEKVAESLAPLIRI